MKPAGSIEELKKEAVVVLDLGTSWTRCMVFDATACPVDPVWAKQPVKINSPVPGASEIDPEPWFDSVCACLDEVCRVLGKKQDQVAGVGICSLAGNVLGVDKTGNPVTPAFTYGDTRAQEQALELKSELDEDEIRHRTGCPLHTAYLPARLLWVARKMPGAFEKAARWISLGEYLENRLFGSTAVSVSMASWSGLLNLKTLDWDSKLVKRSGISKNRLSPIALKTKGRRGLVPEFARRWPALKKIPWFPAIGDGAAANLGCGCHDPGRVAVTVGTSSAVRVVTPEPVDHVMPGLWLYKVDQRRNLVGGALNEGGNLYQWLVRLLGGAQRVSAETVFSKKPDGHGLTVLPFWAGERSVGWNGDAKGLVNGFTLSTRAEDLVRAVLESVALRLAEIFNRLGRVTDPTPVLVAGGGALAASKGWRRIIADALGRPLQVTAVTEVSARGVAVLALESLGIIPDAGAVPDFIESVHEPDPRHYEIYQNALERQNRLYRQMMKGRQP